MSDTTTRPEPVRLDDLADPQFSPEARAIVEGAGALASGVRLQAGPLMEQAVAATGLDDFGPDDFVERLELLLWCFEHEAPLSPMGRVSAASQMTQLLQNRLLLT